MSISERERVSHVVRRLSMGAHPELLAGLDSTDAAIARALDLSAPAPVVPPMAPPASYKSQRPVEIVGTISWWLDQMRSSPRLIEERLVWFWHDHFATSLAKVRVPYLMHQQHVTVRAHATTSFADLLHAVAKDPAMLLYLDGITNSKGKVNENFGRECLELFTMGIGGGYTQDDVVAASRSFTGWIANIQGRPFSQRLNALGIPPWQATFLKQRHDPGMKTLLGQTGAFDLDSALDVILRHPSTGRFVAGKLYRELIGLGADDATTARLGDAFARDWSIMGLVQAITAEPAFTSDAAVRSRVRTPVEKVVGIAQAGGSHHDPARHGPQAREAGSRRRRRGAPRDGIHPLRAAERRRVPEGHAAPRAASARARVRSPECARRRSCARGRCRRVARPVRVVRCRAFDTRRAHAREGRRSPLCACGDEPGVLRHMTPNTDSCRRLAP